jgi:hypothetical protein
MLAGKENKSKVKYYPAETKLKKIIRKNEKRFGNCFKRF